MERICSGGKERLIELSWSSGHPSEDTYSQQENGQDANGGVFYGIDDRCEEEPCHGPQIFILTDEIGKGWWEPVI